MSGQFGHDEQPPPGWESRTTEFVPPYAGPPPTTDQGWGDPATPYAAPAQNFPAPNWPPPYGGPPYGGPPYGGPPYGFAPVTPSRSRRWLVPVLALVVVAVVVAVAWVIAGADDSPAPGKRGTQNTAGRTITLPASAAGFSEITSLDTTGLKTTLGSQLQRYSSSAAASVQHAQIGAYRDSTAGRQLVFIAFALQDLPRLKDELDQRGLQSTLRQFMAGVGTKTGASAGSAVSPGPLGGAQRCAGGSITGQSTVNCGWADESYFALTVLSGAMDQSAAAATTRTFRAAVEH